MLHTVDVSKINFVIHSKASLPLLSLTLADVLFFWLGGGGSIWGLCLVRGTGLKHHVVALSLENGWAEGQNE